MKTAFMSKRLKVLETHKRPQNSAPSTIMIQAQKCLDLGTRCAPGGLLESITHLQTRTANVPSGAKGLKSRFVNGFYRMGGATFFVWIISFTSNIPLHSGLSSKKIDNLA